MKKFSILENGQVFATIEARTAMSAARKAAREYPRRASDYNLESGETSECDWYVWDDDLDRVGLIVQLPVPSRGDARLRVIG